MTILELHVLGKHPDPLKCEDVLVVSDHLVAVIDGATDKSGRLVTSAEGAVTSGRFAATVLAAAVAALPPSTPPADAVAHLTSALANAIEDACGLIEPHDRPSASIVVLDVAARQVWRVGDCPFRIDGITWNSPKRIDLITSDFRAAFLAATAGIPGGSAQTTASDPGREVILPLLRVQGNLANSPGEFGFGVLNGTTVPAEFIEVVDIPKDAREVVLASDGYPTLPATLAEAEEDLARLLALDPTCVGPLRSTKGLAAGMSSFDDRSWIRTALSE